VDLIHNTLSRLYPLWNNDPEKLRQLAAMQLRSGNSVDARKSLDKALTLAPTSYPVRADLVQLDLADNDYNSAQKRVTALQDEFGDRTQTSYLLGEIALARGEPEAAQRYFMAAFELNADNTDAIARLYQLGMQGIGTGAFAAALESVLKTASLPPWAVRMLADSYLQQGEEKKALLYYEKLLDLPEFAEDPGVLNNLANIYANEDLDKALVTARKALDLEDEQSSALLDTVGWILARQGKNEEALPYLRKAYTQNAGDPEIRFHTGMVLLALGRSAEARVELQAALASTSEFAARPEAERVLSTL
jgi:tetratricopeptide (TPR) repeat protein